MYASCKLSNFCFISRKYGAAVGAALINNTLFAWSEYYGLGQSWVRKKNVQIIFNNRKKFDDVGATSNNKFPCDIPSYYFKNKAPLACSVDGPFLNFSRC